MSYLASTLAGLEDVAAHELHGKVICAQRVSFSKQRKVYRSVHRVVRLLADFSFTDLESIVCQIRALPSFPLGPCRVECERKGDHPFRSPDVERAVGEALLEGGFALDLKEPKEIFFVDILHQRCFIGILVVDHLCKRAYRVRVSNQSIHPCIAYALLCLAGARKSDVILDPFCKDGVIPLEAFLSGITKIHAFDSFRYHVKYAAVNAAMVKAKIGFRQYDVSWMTTLFKERSVDCIVTNLFISKRDGDIQKTLGEFFQCVAVLVRRCIALVTNKPELVLRHAFLFSIALRRDIFVGEMCYSLFILKKS